MIGMWATFALLVIAAAVAFGQHLQRRRRACITVASWSCEVGGEVWTWRAERIGGVWSLTSDEGHGGLFASVTEVHDWVISDIHRRLA